jgi:hypothetical protein
MQVEFVQYLHCHIIDHSGFAKSEETECVQIKLYLQQLHLMVDHSVRNFAHHLSSGG